MLDRVKSEVVTILAKVQLREDSEVDELERRQQEAAQRDLELKHQRTNAMQQDVAQNSEQGNATYVREGAKVGRNAPCPCGSGKKYKQCHGKLS